MTNLTRRTTHPRTRGIPRVSALPTVGTLLLSAVALPVRAQDANILRPISEIERQLSTSEFEVQEVEPSRGHETERTFRLTLTLPEDGSIQRWKLAPAAAGADEFNNRPEYELAPYVLQKLFLDEAEYVVPPTAVRVFQIDDIERIVAKSSGTPEPIVPTFREWPITLSIVQYWLSNVRVATNAEIDDRERIGKDAAFARYAANFNLLTYLIRHTDSNEGNYLISTDESNPRIFSVDNGVAFSSQAADRGDYWRGLRFDRFPASSIERLRAVDEATLHARLGVLAQFELRDGAFVPVEPGANLNQERSMRRAGNTIQVGLPWEEINDVWQRVRELLGGVDAGRYTTFP